MRILATIAVAVALAAPSAAAVPAFYDNFENGVSGSTWTKWTGSNQEILQTSTSHNHTLAGSKSALAWQADPTGYNAYADFGTFAGFVRAEVYLFEDYNNKGTNTSQPVTNMLALVGDTGGAVGFGADYLQLGVVSFYPGGSASYGYRTKYNDDHALGTKDTGTSRKAGWTKLAIEADAVSAGGQVRFYIDDLQVGTSQRTATNLRWVRLGNNSKSYENFWYDDVRVVPEPGSLMAMAAGLGSFGFFIRRRRA